jgi:hypothetical protein
MNGIDDLVTVCGDYHSVYIPRGERTFRNPTDHGFSSNFDKGFSG